MFWRKKTLEEHLGQVKRIKVHHMDFVIKKINVLDFCTGAKVVMAIFDTYKLTKQIAGDNEMKKVKAHYIDVLMAGVISPPLSRKPEEGKTLVDHLLTDWELAGELYSAVMTFAYGKKNLKQLISQGKNYSK